LGLCTGNRSPVRLIYAEERRFIEVLAFKRVIRAVPMVGILAGGPVSGSRFQTESDVNLWSDSVGEALTQLGLVLTFGIVARVVIGLLSGLATALG
jgi:hypothetical protein